MDAATSHSIFEPCAKMTSEGHPLPIVFKNEETGTFELDEAALEGVLLSPAIADKRVSVVAVAGAFRKGKTFLLDFLLRYCTNRNSENWLGDESCPLQGFKWRQGYTRETVGIYIWSQPFIVRKSDGEEIALILMDTQGTFDSESSMKDSTVVFALSLLVSSTLVYNLSNNIQEDDLMNLQTFTSYGLQARSDTDNSTAFQKLLFLVRDWNSPAQLHYGNEGGKKLLKERLEIKSCQDPSHRDLRRDLRKCFTDINCYLMPHPGPDAIGKVGFEGRLSEIDPEFVEHLGVLVPLLLAPENLVEKKFGGQTIRAKDLFDSFKMFIETFKSSTLEEPTTMTECMARAASQAALGAAKEDYVQSMEAIVRQNQPIAMHKLKSNHEKFKRRAVDLYKENNKFGVRSKRIFTQWEEKLANAIEQQYQVEYFPRVCSQTAHEAAKKQYKTAMDAFLQREAELTLGDLKAEHDNEQIRALAEYQARNFMAIDNTIIFDEYLELLLQEINEICDVQYMPRVIGQAALKTCLEKYSAAIENLIMNKKSTVKLQILKDKREEKKQKAMSYFQKENTSRGQNAELFNKYQALLEQKIEELFEAKFLSEANSEVERENCVKQYKEAMDGQVQNKDYPLSLRELKREHDTQKHKALNHYHEKNGIGRKNNAAFEQNLKLLKDVIEQQYQVEYFPRGCSQTAHEAAKKQYKTAMDAFLQREAKLTLVNLKAEHDNEQTRALDEYQERNVAAIKNNKIFEEHFQLLLKDINQLYETMYVPRVGSQVTLAACKSQYERAMDSLVKNKASTLTLKQLADFHEEQVQRAITKYQNENDFGQNDPISASKCKTLLQKELVELHDVEYAPLVSSRAARASCLEEYKEALSDCHGDRTKLSLEYLMTKHIGWRVKTIVDYEERTILSRKNPTICKVYEELLLKEIDDVYAKERELRTNSKAALDAGFKLYVDAMEAFLDRNQKLSLAILKYQHEDVMAKAIATYQNRNKISKKNPQVFEGYQKLLKEDIYKLSQKDARIACLKGTELQKEIQRFKPCPIM